MSTFLELSFLSLLGPGSKGLFQKRPAATFFPSKHFGKEPATHCLGGKEGRAKQAEGGTKREMSGHYPTHGDQNMDTIQRLSLHSLKKTKQKQTIHFLAKENEELLRWKLFY